MAAPSRLDRFLTPAPRFDPAAISRHLADHYGLTGRMAALAGERDQNLLLDAGDGRFVVKVVNAAEDHAVVDMQLAALEHIGRVGCEVEVPVVRRTLGGERVVVVFQAETAHQMWVQSELAGTALLDRRSPVDPAAVGSVVGHIQQALAGLFHPAAGRWLLWDVRRLTDRDSPVGAVGDPELDPVIDTAISRVKATVLPALAALPAQIIHHDLNPDNLLAAGSAINGVVDFGDMLHGPRVADLAVAAAYQLFGADDPAEALAEVVRGYQSVADLTVEEIEVLPDLVAARLCQSIAIGAWHAARHPDNAEYLLGDAVPARAGLLALEAIDRRSLHSRLATAAGFGSPPADSTSADLLGKRRRVLAPGLRLSYGMPLHLVSGNGVWVHDAAGRRYLDAYNNVVQVGHGHPLVARTLARQTRRLNTNTRYLTEPVVRYAERLGGLLPDGLDVCFFTNSGSEANDLALRMATTVSGSQGVIVTEHAYHGSTTATMAVSPEEASPAGLARRVAIMAAPGDDRVGTSVEGALAGLDEHGFRPAAVMLDTIFSSDGIFDPPGAYLDNVAAAVRRAGGIYIADEVQAGLGRVGSRLWGFAAGTAVPDIVTLGKPIGNGHPIGVVVTTERIARDFAAGGYFFSTFGGNNVAAAVGVAVLEVTFAEDLPARAERVGAYLREGIEALAADAGQIGAVRGAGLFIGVEIVDGTGRPDAARAEALVEAMRDRGVLIGRTGPGHNVLKIRPPLVFDRRHADVLLKTLTEVLGGSVLPQERSDVGGGGPKGRRGPP